MEVINEKQFEELVLNSKGKVLVDFFATWCGPCKMLHPVLESVSKEVPEVKIYKVDVDEEQELAAKYQVSSIPYMVLFKDGKPVQKVLGYQPKEIIKDWLTK